MSKPEPTDPKIMEIDSPMTLFWHLGALATGLIILATWAALIGAIAAGWLEFAVWLFCTAPIVIWLVLLAIPAMWLARRGALAVLDALATTAEAWLARAGYSIDINRDGYTGTSPIYVEPPQTVRPVLITSQAEQGFKLMPHDTALPAFWDTGAAAEPAPPPRRPTLWQLPTGERIPTETVTKFVEGIFVRGWNRASWVGSGKPLDRRQYDALMALLESAGIIVDRTSGAAGRLAVDGSDEAKKRLGLPG